MTPPDTSVNGSDWRLDVVVVWLRYELGDDELSGIRLILLEMGVSAAAVLDFGVEVFLSLMRNKGINKTRRTHRIK